MKRRIFIFLLLAVYLLVACTRTKVLTCAFPHWDITQTAWNEDTVNSYYFQVMKGREFFYMATDSTGEAHYRGTLRDAADTIFLTYKKGVKPPGLMDYMVRDTSGHYLIQSFTNSKQPLFLRLLPLPYDGLEKKLLK